MDATQMISDSFLESDEEENEEENENKERRPLAKLCILKNEHISETELPLYLGDNVLGRDPNTCTVLLPSPSISKQHATICLSVYGRRGRQSEEDIEALVWDQGSMNGTRKGRVKLTPNVRYALSEGDSLMVADIPCQYVSYAADTVSSQGGFRTPVSRNSGVKSRLPDASGEKGGETSTGSKKCVNRGLKTKGSLPDLEDTRKTPVRTGCLSFEQTPIQPQGTLVPESDSDSDGEKEGRADRRRKALVSDPDSNKFSPTSSTFSSPTSKFVPESEDESPITPSVSTKNSLHKHVSFSKEETDIDVSRQQLQEKKALAIEDNSEEEEEREEERAALEGRKSEESGEHVPVKQESNVSLTVGEELPVSAPAVSTDVIAAFNMDSDTDVEGEEEEEEGVASADPVTLDTNQQADQPPNTAQFYMDSDTDVDEDDDALDKVHKSVSTSADITKPHDFIPVIQPEAITMDSDTDVDDDDAAVSDAASKAKPVSIERTPTVDSAPSTQLKDFHLDSDTDADEEEEKECVTVNTSSKIDETPSRLDIKSTGSESTPAAPHSLHPDSDTDDEVIPAPAVKDPAVDTSDSSLVIPSVVTTLTFNPGAASEALKSDSDAETDVDESSLPLAKDGVDPAGLHVDSDTDVEDDEVDFTGAGKAPIPNLNRENTPGLQGPLLQNCSTPVQLKGEQREEMETQAFLSPLSGPSGCAVAPALRSKSLSSCPDIQGDEDFVVAETQSFILQNRDCQVNPPEDHTMDQTQAFVFESFGDKKGEQSSRGGSFQLGLSDSSHLRGPAQARAMESTQAFVSVEGGVNLEDTQAFTAVANADRSSLENESNLEATQAYGLKEPAKCLISEKESKVDLALEATQAYISEPYGDSEDQTDDDERKNIASAETQLLDFPVSSTLATAETQPMSAFEEEESLDKEYPVSSVLQVKPGTQNNTEGRKEHGEEAQTQERPLINALSVAETQPMLASDNEEDDDEDLIPGSRKPKPQPLTSSELLLVETQPMHIPVDETQPMSTGGNEEIQSPRKRKSKKVCLEEDQAQSLTNSDLSAVETQPMDTGEHEESDEEDSIPGPRKRKAKPLPLEEESTQSLTCSEVSVAETQPMATGGGEQSDDEDSVPLLRKRKAKPLPLEEESTQSLTCSEVSVAETQPMATGGGEQSDDEDSVPLLRKRKAKPLQIQEEETQPLINSEASTVETQPFETKKCQQPQRGKEEQSEAGPSGITTTAKRGTRARFREEEKQAESEPSKRLTRGKNKASPVTRGGRGKSRPYEHEREEEEEVEQGKRPRGRKSRRQQKDNEEEEEIETNKHAQNKSLVKEQEDTGLGEEKDVNMESRKFDEMERKQELSQRSRDQQERCEKEKQEKEEQERMQAENAEKLRLEQERREKETIEKERKTQEEREKAERSQKEKEQLERERKEKEEKEKLEHEKAEREETLQREEKDRMEKERKEQEERERLETAKRELEERLERERKEQEHQARLEGEAKEKERLEKERQEKEVKEKQVKEQQENKEGENQPRVTARGRRGTRTTTATRATEPEQNSTISTNDDAPAKRTRSRSNSSNSVNSERSASSVDTLESRGRGRGRGAKRTSEPPQAASARSSNRRRTVAAEPTDQDSKDVCPPGDLSWSNSDNSFNSEISSCSLSPRGRGARKQGRGKRTGAESIPPINSQSVQNSTPKPTTRGRRSMKAEDSSNVVSHEVDKERADSQQASTTRGRQRANAKNSELGAAGKEDPSKQEEECANEEPVTPKKTARGRGKKAVKSETLEAPVAPAASNSDEATEKRKGQKRELEADTEDKASSSCKIFRGKEKAQRQEAAEEDTKDETKGESPVQAKIRGRASGAQAKKRVKDSPTDVERREESQKMEETAEKRSRVPPSAKQKNEEQDERQTSVDQDEHVTTSKPQTPTSSASRKRHAPVDSSPVAKTPRSSSASPAASGRSRAAGQAYKVLFTGVVDEAGERVVARLGGSIAKGVADMNFLVTDKVRRTVKFLCAVAKGVPIVNTHWLEKSGKAGSFLPPNAFVVKDAEQEKKFNFCLQESLRIASSQPLLQGYEIHVTKSVKPEPAQMKDIITCSGATFLARMPSSHKPQTVVISCEEDWPLCGPALSASLPVVTAEFILTGILQQKLDFQTHCLSAPVQPAGGRGRGGRKKS